MKYLFYLLASIASVVVLLKFPHATVKTDDRDVASNISNNMTQASTTQSINVSKNPQKRVVSVAEPSSKNLDSSRYSEPSPIELLRNGAFEEVLAIYSSESTAKRALYESALVEYLTILAVQNPSLAKQQLLSFLEVSPDNRPIMEAIVELYRSENKDGELVAILKELRENYLQELNDEFITKQIHQVAKEQIKYLSDNQDYQHLMPFLYDMVEYDDLGGYYSLELARNYTQMGKPNDALNILESLQYDKRYAKLVKDIKDGIDGELETGQYRYALDLEKHGEHYFLDIALDGRFYKLMLDTGASLIMIDSEQSADFEIINDNVTIQTAGDPVSAELRKATLLQAGEIELQNVRFISAPFQRDGMDGLLGMNFFNKFDFKIDQNAKKLYLNPKQPLNR